MTTNASPGARGVNHIRQTHNTQTKTKTQTWWARACWEHKHSTVQVKSAAVMNTAMKTEAGLQSCTVTCACGIVKRQGLDGCGRVRQRTFAGLSHHNSMRGHPSGVETTHEITHATKTTNVSVQNTTTRAPPCNILAKKRETRCSVWEGPPSQLARSMRAAMAHNTSDSASFSKPVRSSIATRAHVN